MINPNRFKIEGKVKQANVQMAEKSLQNDECLSHAKIKEKFKWMFENLNSL